MALPKLFCGRGGRLSNLRQITDSDYSWVDNLVWSPDGSRIAFTSSWRIFVVPRMVLASPMMAMMANLRT